MRIENKKLRKDFQSKADKAGTAIKTGQRSSLEQSFQDVWQEQSAVLWQKRLELLLGNLEEVGQRLVKTFSVYDLLAYKEMLRTFLKESLQQIYGLRKETGWSGTGRPKLYQRVELLDQELEELTKIVLGKQKDSVKLLKKLDSIRGLLLDLYS